MSMNVTLLFQRVQNSSRLPGVTTIKGCSATVGEDGVLRIIRFVGEEGGMRGGDTPLKCTPFS